MAGGCHKVAVAMDTVLLLPPPQGSCRRSHQGRERCSSSCQDVGPCAPATASVLDLMLGAASVRTSPAPASAWLALQGWDAARDPRSPVRMP